MQYFCSFESYALFLLENENIRDTKCPISTYPARKVTLACFACKSD